MKSFFALTGALVLVLAGLAFTTFPGESESPPVIAAVGDIACRPPAVPTATSCHHRQVAELLADRELAAFLPLGDLQYDKATLTDFASYDEGFGPYKDITKPAIGNHEYLTPNGQGYKDYFGDAATPQGTTYYSYDVGAWHMIALDSNCLKVGGCAPKQPQGVWLKTDLKAHPSVCTLAYWHHPRYNAGGEHGGAAKLKGTWNTLDLNGVDIVLQGHEHSYQRFVPMDAYGSPKTGGIRSFVVGSGGKSHYNGTGVSPFWDTTPVKDQYGMLFLTLEDASYQWEFQAESGQVLDTGAAMCNG